MTLTIGEDHEILYSAGKQVALVSNATGGHVGTLTDGDLRQVFFHRTSLKLGDKSYLNRRPHTIAAGTAPSQALEITRVLAIRALPIVDDRVVIIGVLTLATPVRLVKRATPVVIVAGGQGSRLGHINRERCKPLVHLGDELLSKVILRQPVAQRFPNEYFSVNFPVDDIKSHFRDRHRYGITVSYLKKSEPLRTDGSSRLLPNGPWEDVLIVNGDLVTSADFGALPDAHVEDRAKATIERDEHLVEIPLGVVHVRENDVLDLEKKPVRFEFVSAGNTVLRRADLSHVAAEGPTHIPENFRTLQRGGGRRQTINPKWYWMDVGTLNQRERAHRNRYPGSA